MKTHELTDVFIPKLSYQTLFFLFLKKTEDLPKYYVKFGFLKGISRLRRHWYREIITARRHSFIGKRKKYWITNYLHNKDRKCHNFMIKMCQKTRKNFLCYWPVKIFFHYYLMLNSSCNFNYPVEIFKMRIAFLQRWYLDKQKSKANFMGSLWGM